jgi:hypothetical protein
MEVVHAHIGEASDSTSPKRKRKGRTPIFLRKIEPLIRAQPGLPEPTLLLLRERTKNETPRPVVVFSSSLLPALSCFIPLLDVRFSLLYRVSRLYRVFAPIPSLNSLFASVKDNCYFSFSAVFDFGAGASVTRLLLSIPSTVW